MANSDWKVLGIKIRNSSDLDERIRKVSLGLHLSYAELLEKWLSMEEANSANWGDSEKKPSDLYKLIEDLTARIAAMEVERKQPVGESTLELRPKVPSKSKPRPKKELNEAEAKIVELRKQGSTVPEITQHLNEANILAKRGGNWTDGALTSVIKRLKRDGYFEEEVS